MPIVLILIGSIGWLANVVIAWQLASNVDNAMSVSGHTSNAFAFLWLTFGGLIWQFFRK